MTTRSFRILERLYPPGEGGGGGGGVGGVVILCTVIRVAIFSDLLISFMVVSILLKCSIMPMVIHTHLLLNLPR